MLLLTILLVSITITIASMPFCRSIACKLQAVDAPNERKVHEQMMPKCGGMAMALGALCPVLLWVRMNPFSKAALIGALIIVFFGVLDDIKELRPKAKFGGQIAAGIIAIFVGGIKIKTLGHLLPAGMVLPDWFALPFTLLVIVGVTNAINLADGLDGLAGGISLLVFICIGYLAYCQKDSVATMFAIAMGGATLGFLRFNTYPAELFMGDAGSQLLGFVSILLLLKVTQQSGQCSTVLPLVVLGLPVIDTLTVMAYRAIKGRSPFRADKNHFHHQLMHIGLYHSEAVLSLYIVQAMLIVVAIVLQCANEWILLAAYLFLSILLSGSLFLSVKTRLRLNRSRYLDPLKAKLRAARGKGSFIVIAFGFVKMAVPILLVFNCLVSPPIPKSYMYFSIGILMWIIFVWCFKKVLIDRVIRMTLYIITPFTVFLSDVGIANHFDTAIIRLYNFSYLFLFLSVLLTVYLTRRSTRFQSSTMDFLVVFTILLISNLPFTEGQNYQMGLVAAKTVVFFFSYEVLLGELRLASPKVPLTAIMMVLLLANVKTLLF